MFRYAAVLLVAAFGSTEAAQVEMTSDQRIKMREQIDSAIDEYLTAGEGQGSDVEWGFLKNIVNIDRFFAGPQSAWELSN